MKRAILCLIGLCSLAGAAVFTDGEVSARNVRVSLIGDSLVKQSEGTYENALREAGFSPLVNGVGSRAVRAGWQCRVEGVLRIFPERVSQNCKPEGIEQIKLWRRSGELGDRLVLALGTNDAALYPSSEVRGRLDAARKAAGGVAIHLVTAAKLTGPKSRARVEAWNREARAWCAADGNCSMIEWGETKWARDPGTYTGDKVHLSGRGLSKRAKFISETLKKQVSEGL